MNVSVSCIPSDLLVIEFSAKGIYISEKSACKSGDKSGSYVIKALLESDNADIKSIPGSLRFSLGRGTDKTDLDNVIFTLVQILNKLKRWYN